MRPFLEAGCVDVLQPDVAHAGGISELRRIAAMAEAYDVAVGSALPARRRRPGRLPAGRRGHAPTSPSRREGLGIHYNAGSGADISSYIRNDPAAVWHVRDGYLDVLAGPGLGIDVDEDQVRRLSRGAQPWTNPGFVGPGGDGQRMVVGLRVCTEQTSPRELHTYLPTGR